MSITLGIVGGTGDLGMALALQFAKKYEVCLGSRSLEKATAAVDSIRREKGPRDYLKQNLKPVENADAVKMGDIVLVTVPHDSAVETVQNLSNHFREGQFLISTVAAVGKSGEEFVADFGSGRSYAQKMREIVPLFVRVAAAFQTVPANILYKEREISSDVLVAADDSETFAKVAELVNNIDGLHALYLGTLNLSGEIERLTALLLNVAKRNKLKSPTLKFNSF
jgi:NADPH-dependent F420 reductase